MNKIQKIFNQLLNSYGPQGWWPLQELDNTKNIKITKSASIKGYHPGDYSFPRTDAQRFEICVGAILTQNTAWPNVERALLNLKRRDALNAKRILAMKTETLAGAIKPAGYFNQKAKKLKTFAEFYLSLKGRTPTREQLLPVWGIGKETADSMLLYAFEVPTFVVDAYTRRIVSHCSLAKENTSYDEVKALFENNLKTDLVLYQEFHALLVEHAKQHYSRKPYGKGCRLRQLLQRG